MQLSLIYNLFYIIYKAIFNENITICILYYSTYSYENEPFPMQTILVLNKKKNTHNYRGTNMITVNYYYTRLYIYMYLYMHE